MITLLLSIVSTIILLALFSIKMVFAIIFVGLIFTYILARKALGLARKPKVEVITKDKSGRLPYDGHNSHSRFRHRHHPKIHVEVLHKGG